jgi:hypothetical protein
VLLVDLPKGFVQIFAQTVFYHFVLILGGEMIQNLVSVSKAKIL